MLRRGAACSNSLPLWQHKPLGLVAVGFTVKNTNAQVARRAGESKAKNSVPLGEAIIQVMAWEEEKKYLRRDTPSLLSYILEDQKTSKFWFTGKSPGGHVHTDMISEFPSTQRS